MKPPPAPPGLRASARFALAPGLPRNDVGHEKETRGDVVDSRAYRRPTRITRRHLFRVGQRAARSVQKGDLPSSGEPVGFCWFKVANARRKATVLLHSWVCRCRKAGRSLSGGAFSGLPRAVQPTGQPPR